MLEDFKVVGVGSRLVKSNYENFEKIGEAGISWA